MNHAARFLSIALLLLPLSAQAQFTDAIGGLFSKVNSIVFYTQVGALSDNSVIEGTVADFGVIGVGTEVLIDLPTYRGSTFELSLGTNYLRGFEATEPTLDLRASVRTLPTIAVYASFAGVSETAILSPYAGVNFGFAELWNASGYAPDGTIYGLNGDTYEIGITGGLYVNGTFLNGLYVEAGYRVRNFENLNWATDTLPEGWPRAFDTSGVIVNIGWQFRIGGDEDTGT